MIKTRGTFEVRQQKPKWHAGERSLGHSVPRDLQLRSEDQPIRRQGASHRNLHECFSHFDRRLGRRPQEGQSQGDRSISLRYIHALECDRPSARCQGDQEVRLQRCRDSVEGRRHLLAGPRFKEARPAALCYDIKPSTKPSGELQSISISSPP
jgi:hypothetical protein